MSLIMDNRLESVDTEAEVKKLQALVKQLELQNEELRSERQAQLMKREGEDPTPTSNIVDSVGGLTVPPVGGKEHGVLPTTPKRQLKTLDTDLDEMDPIGLEAELSDDETWLFDSPQPKPHNDEWLRRDVDDPSLIITRKTLLQQLDQIATSPHHSPHHSYSPCSSGVLSPESPPSSRDGSSRECLARSSGSLGSEEDDRLSSASESSFSYHLADVADVNALARLQEESLRLPDPRRGSRLPGMRSNNTGMTYASAGSGGSATSSQEDLLGMPQPTGSPRRPARGLQAPRRYTAQKTPSREGSDLSTPPDSPYNSQHNLQVCNGRTGSRLQSGLNRGFGGSDPRLLEHNTPNSSRGVSPARSHDSPLASHSDARQQVPRTSRLQAPQQMRSRLSAPSPVRIPMGGASGIPQPTEIPRPKMSGIPRPGSRLQAPKTRSGIAQPRYQAASQEDWRDGCF